MEPKYEKRALLAEIEESVEDIVETKEELGAWLPGKNQHRKRKLKTDSPEGDPPGKSLAIL